MAIIQGLSTLLFPYGLRCPLCGGVAPRKQDPLCKHCRKDVDEMVKGLRPCIKCGRFISNKEYFCSDCDGNIDFPFALARGAAVYEGKIKEQIHLFKYLGKRSLAQPFADLMVKVLKSEKAYQPIDSVVAVPLHANRLQERTFNQAEDLAVNIARKLKKPYLEEVLWRIVDTPTQVSLNKKERNKNLKGAFTVTNPEVVENKNILLIDDIFTTGNTVSESTVALQKAGAKRVAILTLATGKKQY